MLKGIKIRKATNDDLSALEKVGDQLFDYPIKRNRAIEFLNDPRHHLVLAFHVDNIVGMASGFHHVHPDKDPALFIDEVGVLEGFQGKGIGSGLVHYLCEHGKKLGCKMAWVLTGADNKAARKTYSKAGGAADKNSFILFEFET